MRVVYQIPSRIIVAVYTKANRKATIAMQMEDSMPMLSGVGQSSNRFCSQVPMKYSISMRSVMDATNTIGWLRGMSYPFVPVP